MPVVQAKALDVASTLSCRWKAFLSYRNRSNQNVAPRKTSVDQDRVEVRSNRLVWRDYGLRSKKAVDHEDQGLGYSVNVRDSTMEIVVDEGAAVAVKQKIRMSIGCWIFDENRDITVCSGRRVRTGQDVYEWRRWSTKSKKQTKGYRRQEKLKETIHHWSRTLCHSLSGLYLNIGVRRNYWSIEMNHRQHWHRRARCFLRKSDRWSRSPFIPSLLTFSKVLVACTCILIC